MSEQPVPEIVYLRGATKNEWTTGINNLIMHNTALTCQTAGPAPTVYFLCMRTCFALHKYLAEQMHHECETLRRKAQAYVGVMLLFYSVSGYQCRKLQALLLHSYIQRNFA